MMPTETEEDRFSVTASLAFCSAWGKAERRREGGGEGEIERQK